MPLPPTPDSPPEVSWSDDGHPSSWRFGDIYHSRGSALAQARHVFLESCGLPEAWRGRPGWVVAETGFGLGLNFLATWRAWQDDPQRCRHLHYAALDGFPVTRAELLRAATAYPAVAGLASELAAQYPEPATPGFHVLTLDGGRVTLTLCIGEVLPMLQSWRFLADSVFLDGFSPARNPAMWTPDVLRAVARLSHRQTRLATWTIASAVRRALADAGFTVTTLPGLPPKRDCLAAHYAPRWPAPAVPHRAAGNATVVGAGLAGAALCRALGRRGWQLTLLDAASAPAAGASSLPAGLLAPHGTAAPTPLSRLTDAGAAWMARELPRLLPEGHGWQRGVLRKAAGDPPQGHWLPAAMQVTPAALVAAWLAEARNGHLQEIWNSPVTRLVPDTKGWALHGAGGQTLHTAGHVVLASAWGCATLLASWGGDALRLSPVRGQLSLGRRSALAAGAALPAHPINGDGVFLPDCAWRGDHWWATGATYERGESLPAVQKNNTQANQRALAEWLPAVAADLAPAFDAGQVTDWAQIRCATGDRVPAAGSLPDVAAMLPQHPVHQQPRLQGLHLLAGLGSRGLTLALLCAEVLAARLGDEPLPVPADLADALDPARLALRRIRRAP